MVIRKIRAARKYPIFFTKVSLFCTSAPPKTIKVTPKKMEEDKKTFYDNSKPADIDSASPTGTYYQSPVSAQPQTTQQTYDSQHSTVRNAVTDDERALVVMFGPNCADEKEFMELFKSEGFPVFTDFRLQKYGTLRLRSEAEAESFIQKFNGYNFNGTELYAKPLPQQQLVKTLYITGIEENNFTERRLFHIIAPFGFIRRISSRKGFAFVEFDTFRDAQRANRELKKLESQYGIRVSYARSEHKCDLSNLTIPLSDLIRYDHPFWYKLQDMLYDK